MTTIAYRDGVMAADSRAYSGNRRPIGWKVKIRRLPDGGLFGGSSSSPGNVERLFRWVAEHGVEAELSSDLDAAALVVRPNGEVWFFGEKRAFSGPLRDEFFAIGSGEDYALGAMAMDASAVKAVAVARIFDVYTDGEIVSLKLSDGAA